MKRQKLNSRRTAALLASTLVLSQAEPILALADVKVETAAETVTDENTVVITSVDDLVQMSKNCVLFQGKNLCFDSGYQLRWK